MMKRRDPFESKRTRHAPTIYVGYDRNLGRDKATLMTGEPRCKAPGGPGTTSAVEVLVTCKDCLQLMAEGK